MSEQGEVWAAYIDEQLAAERARRDRIDGRAQSLLQNSAIYTILIGFLTALDGKDAHLSPGSKVWVVGSLVCAVAAILAALIAMILRPSLTVAAAGLRFLVTDEEQWRASAITARNVVLQTKVDAMESLMNVNEKRARWVTGGAAAQLLAVAALAVGVAISLLRG